MANDLDSHDFRRLCWYVGEKYLRDLRAKEDFTPRVLESIEAISEFLVSEVRVMERSPETARRDVRDEVPGDKVKDAPALARELRWRVRLAGGYTSDDEDHFGRALTQDDLTPKDVGRKRKRDSEFPPIGVAVPSDGMFRNFQPKTWETVEEEQEESMRHVTVQDIDSLAERLSEWKEELDASAPEGHEVEVGRRRQVISKTRKTVRGFERQRTERVLEKWSWDHEVLEEADVANTRKGISPTGDS